MENALLNTCIITAASLTGILCGASLDQSIKQLPARHVIGIKAFSAYAKAADLKNGVPWYAVLGIGSALASIAAAILTWKYNPAGNYSWLLYFGGIFAVLHSVCTMLAAPTYHKQKKTDDAESLTKLFNRFERIQTIRSVFVTLNLIAYIGVFIEAL